MGVYSMVQNVQKQRTDANNLLGNSYDTESRPQPENRVNVSLFVWLPWCGAVQWFTGSTKTDEGRDNREDEPRH